MKCSMTRFVSRGRAQLGLGEILHYAIVALVVLLQLSIKRTAAQLQHSAILDRITLPELLLSR